MTPKCSSYIPQTEHSVTKLWTDSGYTHKRPEQIEVEIYKNDNLWDTQILNSDNGWNYTWQADADDSRWSVVEKNVPAGYTVSVSENSGVFSIVNTYKAEKPKEDPDDDPKDDLKDDSKDEQSVIHGNPVEIITNVVKTGDSHSVHVFAILMCLSGIGLVLMGVYRNRKHNEEK